MIKLSEGENIMLIIELSYIKSLSEVNLHVEAHRDFIKKYTDLGIFLTSGPKVPRKGGIILSNVGGREIKKIIQQDPFYYEKLAEFKIIEFNPSIKLIAGEV